MALVPTDVIRATAVMTGSRGQLIENVYYFAYAGVLGISDVDASADIATFLDDLYTTINTMVTSAQDYNHIELFNVSQQANIPAVPWPVLTVGGTGLDALPAGVSALVTFPTATLKCRGRKYLGQLVEAVNENDAWTAPALALLADYAALLQPGFVGDTTGEQWYAGAMHLGTDFAPFTQSVISGIPAYQRRRRFGAGR